MLQQAPLKLFNGWATIYNTEIPVPQSHIPDDEELIEPRSSEPFFTFELAISKRPAKLIEVFSPTNRPVGDHYFRTFPLVHFSSLEITRIVCVLWRHAAVIRFHELWQSFTIEQFLRGYQGKLRLRGWLENVIRGTSKLEDRVSLKALPHSHWMLSSLEQSYPHIRRWSSETIAVVKAFAWRSSQQGKREES